MTNSLYPQMTGSNGEISHVSPPVIPLTRLSAEDQKRVDTLNKELDNIFGTPKENLTDAEKKKESELTDAIDKILQKTEPEPLTKVQEKQLDSILEEIDKLFEDSQLTFDEEKKLTELESRLDKLFTPKVLSDADQKELDKLFDALDDLYGIKKLSEAEIARTEEIYAELDEIYAKANTAEHESFDTLDIIEECEIVSFGEFGVDSFVINEFENLRIENFNPSEGDILMFDKNLGLESEQHLTSLVSQVIQNGEDLFINLIGDDASITLTGISLDELSWANVAIG